MVVLISGCKKGNTESQLDSISIEREELVAGLRGQPSAMAQTSVGGFVIVGALETAWAVGTNQAGEQIWKYVEPSDPALNFRYQSAFHGVLPIANRASLLCGQSSTKKHPEGTGLIIKIDASGQVLEHRAVFPNDDESSHASALLRCTPWGDGLALVGTVKADNPYNKESGWVVMLDSNGAKRWERISADLPNADALEEGDGSLVLTGIDGFIVRIGRDGRVLASASSGYRHTQIIRSLSSDGRLYLIGIDSQSRNILLTLDNDLKATDAGKVVGPPGVRDGIAFHLADGSTVLFGSKLISGGVHRSAIGWVNRHDGVDIELEMLVKSSRYSSLSIRSAIPESPGAFVVMRDQVSALDPAETGVMLAWVIFK